MTPGDRPSKSQAAQLPFLGAGQAHHVLGVVGRPLDQCQRLQHRVVDVRGHLGPLLGPGAGLALGDEVAHQAQPPGPEDDHGGRDDQCRTADGLQGRDRGVPLDQQRRCPTAPISQPTTIRTTSRWRRPCPWMSVPSSGTTSWSMNCLLRLVGVAPDEDEEAGREQGGPADEPDEGDVQGAGDQPERG